MQRCGRPGRDAHPTAFPWPPCPAPPPVHKAQHSTASSPLPAAYAAHSCAVTGVACTHVRSAVHGAHVLLVDAQPRTGACLYMQVGRQVPAQRHTHLAPLPPPPLPLLAPASPPPPFPRRSPPWSACWTTTSASGRSSRLACCPPAPRCAAAPSSPRASSSTSRASASRTLARRRSASSKPSRTWTRCVRVRVCVAGWGGGLAGTRGRLPLGLVQSGPCD